MDVATVANHTGMEFHGLSQEIIAARDNTSHVEGPHTEAKVAELLTGAGLSQYDLSSIADQLEQEAWNRQNLNIDDPEAPPFPGFSEPEPLVMELDITSRQYDPNMDGIPATNTTPKVTLPQPVTSLAAATAPNQQKTVGATFGITHQLREATEELRDEWLKELAPIAND